MQGPQLCAKPRHFCKLDVATSRMTFLDLNLHFLQVATSNSNNWGRSVVQNCTLPLTPPHWPLQQYVQTFEYIILGQSKLMCQRENLSRVLYLPKMASSLKLFWVFQVCLHQSLTRSTVSFGTFIRNMYWLRRSKWNIYSSWADVAFAIISFTFPKVEKF